MAGKMNSIFVDTQGWVAIINKRDKFHDDDIRMKKSLIEQNTIFITTDFVLDETYTLTRIRLNHGMAVAFGEMIRRSQYVKVIQISEMFQDKAWEFFKKYEDKSFSFTDCTSFVIMEEFNLEKSFTNDHHFEQAGFSILLK